MRSTKDQVNSYIAGLKGHSESARASKIRQELTGDSKVGINIGFEEAYFLQWLIHTTSIKSVVEVGTQYGYSTSWLLDALPQEATIYSLEKNPEHYEKAKSLIKDSRVQFLCGDARVLLKELTGPFDLIFIDANKSAYMDYFDWALEATAKGSIIVADNTFLFGQVFELNSSSESQPENGLKKESKMLKVMKAYNEKAFSDPRLKSFFLPTNEGMTVSVRIA